MEEYGKGKRQMKEYFDVIDEEGNPTGEIVDRLTAHRIGIRHRVAHVWLVRRKNGEIQVLLQKRAAGKDAFPGCYDISSAGHVSAGEDFETTAVREVKEELGIHVSEKDLIFCGNRNVVWDGEFYGKPFHDRHHAKVFMIWMDLDEGMMNPDPSEVESVMWMNLHDCIEGVKNDSFFHCLTMEELLMVKKALKL